VRLRTNKQRALAPPVRVGSKQRTIFAQSGGTTLVVPLRTVNRGTLKAPAVLAAADVSPFFGTRGDQRFWWEGTTLVVPFKDE